MGKIRNHYKQQKGRHLTIGGRHIFLVAWFCIHILVALPYKLPLVVNFLLFMAIEIILTNKLTIIGFNLNLFRINTTSIPHFLSLILHNDFTLLLSFLPLPTYF